MPTIRLTGAPAALALGVIVAIAGVRYTLRSTSLSDGAGRSAVERYLAAESQRKALESTDSAAILSGDSAAVQSLLGAREIAIRRIGARGLGDTVYARVTYTIAGTPREHVSYLRLTHSVLTGWQVIGESSAFSYYTRF